MWLNHGGLAWGGAIYIHAHLVTERSQTNRTVVDSPWPNPAQRLRRSVEETCPQKRGASSSDSMTSGPRMRPRGFARCDEEPTFGSNCLVGPAWPIRRSSAMHPVGIFVWRCPLI